MRTASTRQQLQLCAVLSLASTCDVIDVLYTVLETTHTDTSVTLTHQQVLSPTNRAVLSPSNRAVLSPTNRAVLSPTNRAVLSPTNRAVLSPTTSKLVYCEGTCSSITTIIITIIIIITTIITITNIITIITSLLSSKTEVELVTEGRRGSNPSSF
ncbi:hypothetical protein FHG87_025895 [Trinorchestia longiramus]|nr:hypothetical protein FHG87_025895 [Trinorchestia longiramus]